MRKEDNKNYFYQWENGQRLIVDEACEFVVFDNGTDSEPKACEVKDGYVPVPDILLQTAGQLHAYAWDKDKGSVIGHSVFQVLPAPKPIDYIATEAELITVEKLVSEALQAAKESGVFDGKDGLDGIDGKDGTNGVDGYTPQKGEDYFTEADKVEVLTDTDLTAEEKTKARATIGAVGTEGDGENSVVFPGMTYKSGSDKTEEADKRYNEAIGTSSMASGQGAVAYSRSSKSLGYRTQTGYPPNANEVAKRPEAEVKKDNSGDIEYPADNVGQAAVAIGADTVAAGNHSLAGGYRTQAIGDNALAYGSRCIASSKYAIALGTETTASGEASYAEGKGTTASGYVSHAEGYETEAGGIYTHAEGYKTIATKNYTHAEGNETLASGYQSHAEGWLTKSTASATHTEGIETEASSDAAHAEGYKTKATAPYSHAEGGNTRATAIRSHAEGYDTIASGNTSHSEGIGTKANTQCLHVQGKYNILDVLNPNTGFGKYANIVGNGTSDTNRSNAHTIDWSGNGTYAGSVSSTTGADYAEYFEWEDGNSANEDRVGYVVTLDGDKIKKATAEDDILGIISGTAAVIGDTAEWNWAGRFLTDEFGRIITEEVEQFVDEPKEVINEETGKPEIVMEKVSLGFIAAPKVNPEYDDSQAYVNRKDRPEWACVGMFGKLYVRDDGTCQVNGYAKVGVDGEVTASDAKTNIRVLSRVCDTVIRVLLK